MLGLVSGRWSSSPPNPRLIFVFLHSTSTPWEIDSHNRSLRSQHSSLTPLPILSLPPHKSSTPSVSTHPDIRTLFSCPPPLSPSPLIPLQPAQTLDLPVIVTPGTPLPRVSLDRTVRQLGSPTFTYLFLPCLPSTVLDGPTLNQRSPITDANFPISLCSKHRHRNPNSSSSHRPFTPISYMTVSYVTLTDPNRKRGLPVEYYRLHSFIAPRIFLANSQCRSV
ncbi:hypothetical protein EI94DRAFT_940037 [Lactarius quietus]|nr:hypothetical protein EI94DRAFT_940037 [Lactarius quietus]